MASPAAVLSILIKANTAQAQAALRSTQADLNATDKSASKTSKAFAGIGKIAKVGGLAAAAGVALVGPKLIDLASDAEETASKFRIVFGKETPRAIAQLDEFSKATGTSRFALRAQAAQFQALIRPMGLTTKASAGMSVGMTKLATDLASFNNSSVEEAMTALQSGLVGEAEPLRKFGVQLNANRIAAFAYANGIAKQGAELTAAQKAQASYGIILKDTTLAQGDAVRTSGSFANQWKRLKSQITDTATELGIKFLPMVTAVIGGITKFISTLQGGEGAMGGFGSTVKNVWQTVTGAIATAIGFIVGQFQKHRDDYAKVGEAAGNIGRAIAFVWEHVVWPVIRRVLPAIVQIIKGAFDVIGGAVKVLSRLLTGDFRGAWDGVKQIFSGALQIILGLVRGITAPFREAISRIGDAAINILDNAWDRVKQNVRDLFSFFRDAGGTFIDRFVAGFKAAPGALVDAAKWLKDKIVGAVKKFLGIDSPSKVFQEIGGHMISGLIKGMDTGDVLKFIKSSFGGVTSLATKLFGGIVGGGAGIGGKQSGTMKMAQTIANKFGLSMSSGYRSPQHNAAVGGVPNSLHTHGSPGNPGAIDLVGPVGAMNAALIWARQNLNLAESMVHDVGSGLHLHLGFFKRGGFARGMAVVGEGGPELVDFGSRGAQVYSNPQSQAMMAGGPFVNIEHMSVHSGFEARAFAADLAWRVQTA